VSLDFIKAELDEMEKQGLRRTLRAIESAQGREVIIGGRKVLNFCSNNYLGLADENRLKEAAINAIKSEGLGSGASRLVCGTLSAHTRLEEYLAEFKGAPAALVFNSGYAANLGIISALFGRNDMIFSDRLNHASIIDGIILSQAQFKRYPHKDMTALEAMLTAVPANRKKVIITDTVFSMDGDIAPLPEIVRLAKRYDAVVMVDEAHALGVLGKTGKGAVEHFGLEGQVDIQMGTLSKSVGAFGAYVCGSTELIEYLINRSRSFIYTTALPPAIAAAAQKGLAIITAEPQRRQQLVENSKFLLTQIKSLGFDTRESQTPIIPIVVKDSRLALDFSQRLLAGGILVSAIRPPTVPNNTARLRVTVTAEHTQNDLETLLEQLKRLKTKNT